MVAVTRAGKGGFGLGGRRGGALVDKCQLGEVRRHHGVAEGFHSQCKVRDEGNLD